PAPGATRGICGDCSGGPATLCRGRPNPWPEDELAAFDGNVTLAAPLAPRAGVQGRVMQPRHFHGQQVVAGRDARPALIDDVFRGGVTQHRLEFRAQGFRWLEPALCVEIVLEEAVAGARNTAANGVDGFVFAPVAIGTAG